MFHSFAILCENENILLSSLHCFFAYVTPCPLVLLSSLTVKKYVCQYFHTHSIFKKPQSDLLSIFWFLVLLDNILLGAFHN